MILLLLIKILSFFLGHHETPPEAHNKILEKFPDNFPRNQANVIPPTTEKKVEEVWYVINFFTENMSIPQSKWASKQYFLILSVVEGEW